jgi:hypothetical protein
MIFFAQAVLVAILLVLGVADILAIAEAFALDRKCPSNIQEFLCALTTRDTLSAGLLAAAGAIFAAWLAWYAVQLQLQRDERSQTRRLAGLARLIEADLLLIAKFAAQVGQNGGVMDTGLSGVSRETVIEVTEIEPRLAATLAVQVAELRTFAEMTERRTMDSKGAEETRTFATVFALRSQILAACFEEVARRLEMGHEVYLPLLSAKVFRKFLLGHDLTSEQAGYVGVLLDMPPPPSIDGAAPAP